MPKAKITIEFEYEIDPESWPKGYTNEQMLQGDINLIINGDENIYEFETIDDWKVTGEIMKENS
jgi:hypothetical protein